MCRADAPFVFVAGMHSGTRQEEVIDHRLTDREWAEEWKHLDHVRKVITFLLLYQPFVFLSTRKAHVCSLVAHFPLSAHPELPSPAQQAPSPEVNTLNCSLNVPAPFSPPHPPQLLNCIMDMVEKTRRSLTVLRRCQEADREELNYWIRRYSDAEELKKGGASGQSRQQSPAVQENATSGGASHRYNPNAVLFFLLSESFKSRDCLQLLLRS